MSRIVLEYSSKTVATMAISHFANKISININITFEINLTIE